MPTDPTPADPYVQYADEFADEAEAMRRDALTVPDPTPEPCPHLSRTFDADKPAGMYVCLTCGDIQEGPTPERETPWLDEAIEAAARKVYERDQAPVGNWPDEYGWVRAEYREQARAPITNALPIIEAAVRSDERARIDDELADLRKPYFGEVYEIAISDVLDVIRGSRG